MRVLVYNAPSISKIFNLRQLLTETVLPGTGLQLQITDAQNLRRDLGRDVALFILPGARASGAYREQIIGPNLECLKDRMDRGMQVLGLCAGAYVLSRQFDFNFHDERNGRVLEAKRVTSYMGLVDAEAYGPDLRLYEPPGRDGSLQLFNAATLDFNGMATKALVCKAPSFRGYDPAQCTPLATYAATGEAAILRFTFGQLGGGVLSGPSIEVEGGELTSYVDSAPAGVARTVAVLNDSRSTRRELLANVFDALLPVAAPQIRRNLGVSPL